jgi:hypothetical protein
MANDVFISYAAEDQVAATTIWETLESEGFSCWIAPRDVQPGAKWEQAIMDAINASRVMVLVFSEYANRSDHVQREVGSAFENGITVIPIRKSDTKPTGVLAYYLRPVQWIDAFTQASEEYLKSLAVRIRRLLSASETGFADSGAMTVFRDKDHNLIIKLQGLEFKTGGKLMARLNFGCTKGLLGPSTNSSDQRGFQNEENTLFGINHMQLRRMSRVHLFVSVGENFIIVNDVNERVAKFLNESFSLTALRFLRIQSISGTTVRLQTIDFGEGPPHPEKELWVNVDKDGGITLLQ